MHLTNVLQKQPVRGVFESRHPESLKVFEK